ncbi:hypothetical protein [Nocardioides gansuensis]|uniref:hypothetical protein n=1 Tax=Nocardioides gansuensis TaxID=2138300 RepID=UPI001057DC52|nr:hypothetical protein [Nocardioides gansuensis]
MATLAAMAHRGWAWVSSALAGATTVVYLAVVASEGNNSFWDVFPWVMLMLIGTGLAVTSALVRDSRVSRAFALAGVVILGIIGLVSIFSVGIGLLLAAVAAGLAAGGQKPSAN